MTNLIKVINLIYSFFIIIPIIFFSNQFLNNLISIETFLKIIGFSIISFLIMLFSYKRSKKYFDSTIEGIGVNQKIAVPTLMFIFLGGFSVAIAITFIAFLESVGLLLVVESVESLILNILALASFFWLAFILFMGWDFIKISGIVSQYSMVKTKKSSFFKNMKLFFTKLNSLRDAFLALVAIDLAYRNFTKEGKTYYKNLLFPVKVWAACLTIYEDKYIADSLEEAFSYFKNKSFKLFYISHLASFFLPVMIIPIVFSLGIIMSNVEYFSVYCLSGSCFFVIIFFLIFMSLGFFFSYSISISLESAYYVKILNDIKEGKVSDNLKPRVDSRINFIESESYRRISKLKNSIWDIFRIYF